MLPRRVLLAALLALPAAARASGKGGGGGGGGGNGEFFVKLPSIVIEFWDENGVFHPVNMELTAVFHEQTSLNKKVGDRIAHSLSAMPWEEFSRGNPAATVKAVALDVLRQDPTGQKAVEVLVVKLLMR